jgi:hypothetical protein
MHVHADFGVAVRLGLAIYFQSLLPLAGVAIKKFNVQSRSRLERAARAAFKVGVEVF